MTSAPTGDSPVQYIYRRNALEKEQTLTLQDDGLLVEQEGKEARLIPWADVQEVQLQFAPTRVVRNLFTCTIKPVAGRKVFIHSMSFKGFADFEERGAEYSAFLRALHRRLVAANDTVRCVSGSDPVMFWGMLGCNVVIFSVLALVMVVMLFSIPPIAIVKLIILAIYAPLLIKWFKKNKPATYEPGEPPANMLPG